MPSQEKFGGGTAKKGAKFEKLFECKRCTMLKFGFTKRVDKG